MANPPDLHKLIPDVDHPTLNAMRNFVHSDKIWIPVRLFKDGQQVYGADVRMIGHTHSLYRAALDAALAGIADRKPAIEWDEVSFHSDKRAAKADMLRDEASLSAYVTIYRTRSPHVALIDALENMNSVIADPAKADKTMFEHSLLRLCAAIISTSVEVTPDPAYAPAPRKGILQRFMPKF